MQAVHTLKEAIFVLGSMMTLTAMPPCCRAKVTDTVTEAHISLLLNSGLFVRDMQESDIYLFSMAGAGPVVQSLLRQRKVSWKPCKFLVHACIGRCTT